MVLSTPVKAVSGLALTSAGVVGTAVGYRYMNDLYKVEKVAALKDTVWKVTKFSENAKSDSASDKSLSVTVSASITNTTANPYDMKSGTWTCEIVTPHFSSTELGSKKTSLTAELKKHLTNFSDSADTESVTITEEKKQSFVNSCSNNRKKAEQSHEKVTAVLEISADKFEKELEEIFTKGNWVNKSQK